MSGIFNRTEEKIRKENGSAPTGNGVIGSGKPKTGRAANSRYVSVRRGPSGSAQVVETMKSGDSAVILDFLPEFYKIQTEKGQVGYVSVDYFEED